MVPSFASNVASRLAESGQVKPLAIRCRITASPSPFGDRVPDVPYAVLLGLLAFVLEFIPVLGTLVSGAICTLIALTQGWLIALGVLIYFVIVHVLEGDIVGPRIVGKAVGLHPVVSIAALIAGSELFGIWGALFASPIAGVLQSLIVALWTNWHATHPEHFEQVKEQVADKVDESLTDSPQSTTIEETRHSH